MPADPVALVRGYLAENRLPLQVWLAPHAFDLLADQLPQALPDDARILRVPAAAEPSGPAILVATAADCRGPRREALLALCPRALPGRPVICGGTGDKDTLLDAINTWRVMHMLPREPSPEELGDALVRAHRACALEHAATLCAQQLQQECTQLQRAVDELQQTREQLLHAERLTTVGGFARALGARLRGHQRRLEALEEALGTLPDEPRRTELLDFTLQSIHAIEALLSDLLAKAEAAGLASPPSSTHGGGPDGSP